MYKALFITIFIFFSSFAYAQVGPIGSVGPQAGVTCSGVNLTASSNIQTAVDTNAAGTTFCLSAGTYTSQSITPKADNKFIGELGAILDGQNNTVHAFTGNAANVTIQNLVIKNYTAGSQQAPVDARFTSGWNVLNNEIAYNAGAGVTIGDNMLLQRNNIHHNLQEGYTCCGTTGFGVIIDSNEIAFNNYLDTFDSGFEAGGGKIWASRNAQITHNYSHDNHGPGLWTDYDNINTTYAWNRVENNRWGGIYHEVSYSASIHDNVVSGTGGPSCGWMWCSEIQIASSGAPTGSVIDIYNNTVTTSGLSNGIGLIQQDRTDNGTQGPFLVQNIHVHNNTINLTNGGVVGGATDTGIFTMFTPASGNYFQNNTYINPGPNSFWWNNNEGDLAWFRTQGQETQVQTDTTPPTTPSSLVSSVISSSQINLSWTASTDNVGVTGYRVERCQNSGCIDFVQISTPTVTNYSNTGLTASTTYQYRVRAVDSAGNLSGYSNIISATTQAVTSNFTIGETTIFTDSDSGNGNKLIVQNVTLSQPATIQSLSFHVKVAGGNLRLGIYSANGPSAGPGSLKAQTASFIPVVGWNTKPVITPVLLPAGDYWLAYFPSSNLLNFSVVSVTTGGYKLANKTYATMPGTFPAVIETGTLHWSLYATLTTASSDIISPSIPTNLTATATSQTNINLSWVASTDNVAVTGYKIFRNGVQVGTSTTTSFADSNLTANTTYSYTVSSYDAAGNNSAQTTAVSVSTPAYPIPTLNFTNATISWASTNATTCTASWSGTTVPVNGSFTFNAPFGDVNTITCTGAGGTVQRTITITVQ